MDEHGNHPTAAGTADHTAALRAQTLIDGYQFEQEGPLNLLNATVWAVLAEVAEDPNPAAGALLVTTLAIAAADVRTERDALGGTP